MDKDVEKKLLKDFLRAYREAVNNHKFRSLSFIGMLDNHGAYETACRLCNTLNWQSGFEKLALLGRYDLTVEYIVMQDEYRNYFSDRQIFNASQKVNDAKKIKGHKY